MDVEMYHPQSAERKKLLALNSIPLNNSKTKRHSDKQKNQE